MSGRPVTKSMIEFEALANALIAAGARDKTKHAVLAAHMDCEGVQMMSLEVLKHDPVIVALFAERGVRLVEPEADR